MDGTARPGTDAGLSINVDGPCRVVIADDNAVIRMGVRSLLAGADDI